MGKPLELRDVRRTGKFENVKTNYPVMSEIGEDGEDIMIGLEGGEMHLNHQGYLEFVYDPDNNELIDAVITEE